MATDSGQQVIAGRYELTTPISSGGMGYVWRAYDTVLDRDVAVKLIRPDLARDDDTRDELVSRFRREARVTAKIEHSGVPAVHDAEFDSDIDRLYLVMQLVRGMSLSDVFTRQYTRTVAWCASVAAQVCAALSYAHAVPVVHRDLKPSNILIGADGAVTVIDFGVAAVLRNDVTHLTSTGDIVGSKPYMSPEQIHNSVVSPRTDLYGLGCLLHEMLSGHPPFAAADDAGLMYQHLEQPPTPLRQLRGDVPHELEQLVLELLAKRPDDRPASARDTYDRLVPFLPPAEPGSVDVTTHDPTRPYRTPLPPRPHSGDDSQPPPESSGTPAAPLTQEEIDAAYDNAVELIERDRPARAAEQLADIIDRVSDETQARQLRDVHAAARYLDGDYRQALPEFDRLAATHRRASGPDSEEALECRRQAAYCRIELGDLSEALAELRSVLVGYRGRDDERDPDVLDMRRTIARLQITLGSTDQAADGLPELYRDVAAELGADDPLAREVRDMLTRLGAEPAR